MKTNGIDLTKYINLNFKAVVNGGIVSGKILPEAASHVRLDFGYTRFYLNDDNLSRLIDGESIKLVSSSISDFEIVPRDPETYRDWQVGDRCYQPDEDDYIGIMEVIFRSGELVVLKDEDDLVLCLTVGKMEQGGIVLELTDIEKQIIEERKKAEWKPQDGDIVAWKTTEHNGNYAITIFRGKERGYVTLFGDGGLRVWLLTDTFAMNIIRPATQEEKQRLFDAMAKAGKRWNAEKKCVEDIPKPHEFKKGEPVLVRTDYGRDWKLAAYVELSSIPNAALRRNRQCLGTVKDAGILRASQSDVC